MKDCWEIESNKRSAKIVSAIVFIFACTVSAVIFFTQEKFDVFDYILILASPFALSITLTDVNGKTYKPEKIWDINGSRKDIIAVCNNIPRGTRITNIKIVALNNLKVLKIRWWNGKLH